MKNNTKIAIIGYSGSFPNAATAEELWELSSQGKTGLNVTDEDTVRANLPQEFYKQENFRAIGGGPEDYKTFDARFFGYSPKEAIYLDPQIRKSLETAWNAFEHAGYPPNKLDYRVGTYLASSVNSYFLENLLNEFECSNESERSQILFLNEPDFLATRIAYQFNWPGPAFTIKCGCSSSLVATHEACQALLNYDCDMALSGGVAIKPRYHYGYIYEKDGILSENGKCCPFSNSATGTVFANGIGMVVLKRLDDAIEDGDTIHGVICATATNNDGQDKVGYMAPSVSGQIAAMRTALAYAELEPKDISYIETHGTGTEIGDPIEFKGLLEVFRNCSEESIPLGALKGNIGHLDAASGVAGLIKVLQDLKHNTVSPVANFENPNPKMELKNSPFKINKTLSEWHPGPKGRIAVISSFGIGGTNAQLVLEEYQKTSSPSTIPSKYFFPLSAKTGDGLQKRIEDFMEFVEENPKCSLRDISYTLLAGRTHFSYRWSCTAQSHDELCEKLRQSQKEIISSTHSGEVVLDKTLFHNAERLQELWLNGHTIKPPKEPLEGFSKIPLPCYPFAKEEYWMEKGNQNRKISDPAKWFYLPYWKREQIKTCMPNINSKRVLVFANASPLSDELGKRLKDLQANTTFVYASDRFSKRENESYTI
ncbi:MAG: beta-ketoacyl synthase N-terminal-like domain-containing protein, partial [Waddliaceae bacterium]